MTIQNEQRDRSLAQEQDDVVISVKQVSKKFCRNLKRSMIYGIHDLSRSFWGMPGNSTQLRKHEFWALEDISFDLKRGETLGIIGENGSGKTTLLRVLTGIFPPDKGEIVIKGKVGALVAVGAGFHPHMTGRENIYLNGVILGMTRKEIDAKFEDIANFAEIGDFLDAPVSTYSSGMRVRLGFAIAIHANMEILLIDEILSVGDLSFQNKALRKMGEFRQQAAASIFISHSLDHIRNICNRVIILNKGEKIFDGETSTGIVHYQELTREKRLQTLKQEHGRQPIIGSTDADAVEFIAAGILNASQQWVETINVGDPFYCYVEFKVLREQEELIFSFGVLDEKNNVIVWVISNDNERYIFKNIRPGQYRIAIHYQEQRLMPGVYVMTYGIRNRMTYETFQRITNAGVFKVTSEKHFERGSMLTSNEFELTLLKNLDGEML